MKLLKPKITTLKYTESQNTTTKMVSIPDWALHIIHNRVDIHLEREEGECRSVNCFDHARR